MAKAELSNPNRWAATVQEISQLHEELNGLATKTVHLAIKIGGILDRVKSTLKHGEWMPWLKEFAPFSIKSAERFLWCFENQAKIVNLTNLSEAYVLMLPEKSNGSTEELQQLHEPNFHSQAVRLRQNLVGLFNHYLQRRPLKVWHTEEIYDLLCSLKPLTEVCQQLELELGSRNDLPAAYRQAHTR